jgi:hypothetical protein
MESSRRPPQSALGSAHPFAVALWGADDYWATDQQTLALDAALDADSVGADGINRFLAYAESAALDVAGIGFVVGVTSNSYTNKFRFNGMPTPSVKCDAGCPNGFWLPPARLDDRALMVIRERMTADLDAEDVVSWARVQLGAWWSIAASFAPGASVSEIDESGRPILSGGMLPPATPSDDPLGDIWETDAPLVAKVMRCDASYVYSVPALDDNHYDVVGIDRGCVLPATVDGRCRFHR